jgi:multicomponent Na+:H+ antiporter subunit B
VSHRQLRIAALVPALGVVGAILVWGLTGLPAFGDFDGRYSYLLKILAVPQRHTTNVVAAVVWDYRGVDTMGEEFILFAAVAGVVLLLRTQKEKPDEGSDRVESEALRVVGLALVAPVVLVGLWLVSFGTVTPGGGFQGGVVIAAGLLLVYLAWSYAAWHRVSTEQAFDPFESSGVGAYVVIGLLGLALDATFLHNLLGHGKQGTLTSGGSIALLNWATAIEVAGANVLLFGEFLKAYIVPIAHGSGSR